MKVYLCKKIGAARQPVKDTQLIGDFQDYYLEPDKINEELLINTLPGGFLPLPPEEIAIMVEDEIDESIGRVISNRGQRGLEIFEDYDKYTCSYTLLLSRYE